ELAQTVNAFVPGSTECGSLTCNGLLAMIMRATSRRVWKRSASARRTTPRFTAAQTVPSTAALGPVQNRADSGGRAPSLGNDIDNAPTFLLTTRRNPWRNHERATLAAH